jgi:hypothetical protein
MSQDVFEWATIAEITILLVLVWIGSRKVQNLLLQTLNSLEDTRTAVQVASRSYLGIESAWEGSWREMGEFGVKDLPRICERRMGDVFVEMLLELRKIRRANTRASETDSDEVEKS